jgi:hypothetical protein
MKSFIYLVSIVAGLASATDFNVQYTLPDDSKIYRSAELGEAVRDGQFSRRFILQSRKLRG